MQNKARNKSDEVLSLIKSGNLERALKICREGVDLFEGIEEAWALAWKVRFGTMREEVKQLMSKAGELDTVSDVPTGSLVGAIPTLPHQEPSKVVDTDAISNKLLTEALKREKSEGVLLRGDAGGKFCTRCSQWRPLERYGYKKKGQPHSATICKDCDAERAREARASKQDEETKRRRETERVSKLLSAVKVHHFIEVRNNIYRFVISKEKTEAGDALRIEVEMLDSGDNCGASVPLSLLGELGIRLAEEIS